MGNVDFSVIDQACAEEFGVAAIYRARDQAKGVPVTVILDEPDRLTGFGEASVIVPTLTLIVSVDAIGQPEAGDSFLINGETFLVQGAPRRDPLRQIWTCETKVKR